MRLVLLREEAVLSVKWVGRFLLLGVGCALTSSAIAQDDEQRPVTYPKLPAFVRHPADFVPAGWKLIAVKTGDLNGDKRPDAAVLMRMTDPARITPVESNPYYKEYDTNPYLLVVGFAGLKGYKLVASNHSLFPDYSEPGSGETPPDADTVTIARGVLTLAFEHLRGSDTFRFRWNGRALGLAGHDCSGIVAGEITTLSANYLTGRARWGRSKVGEDKTYYATMRIRPGRRPSLEEFDSVDWYFELGKDDHGESLAC